MNRHATVLINGPVGTFLMLKHVKAGQYWFPGGKIDGNELPIAAAARELHEEIGVEASQLRLLDIVQHHVNGKDWFGHYFVCAGFYGVPTIQEPAKHTDMRYLTLEEILVQGHPSDYKIAYDYSFGKGQR